MTQVHPFDAYVQAQSDNLRVAHAALLFALDRFPDIAVDEYLKRLDHLADRVATHNPTTPEDRVSALQEVLVRRHGLTGCTSDFCDPCGSYLNRVLDRGHGLPIALCAVWLDVAATLGWELHGVGMPGHFLIACPSSGPERIFIDPFGGGKTLDRSGCAELLCRCFGQTVELAESHLAPVSDRSLLSRMLCNLRSLYCASQHWRCAERVLQRLLALHPCNGELVEEISRMRRLACEQN
ncbi:MAG TPA: transglutaminase-like domain-containing protein [Phycisphaerae bacterium]|nr:transglutaminase-like domain-containing protein [Phycisphaerae bacterium]